MTRKKAPKYQAALEVSDLNEAKVLIEELLEQLRHYENKLSARSQKSSKAPSSDTPKDRYERKKMKTLVVAIQEELNKVAQDINKHSRH